MRFYALKNQYGMFFTHFYRDQPEFSACRMYFDIIENIEKIRDDIDSIGEFIVAIVPVSF